MELEDTPTPPGFGLRRQIDRIVGDAFSRKLRDRRRTPWVPSMAVHDSDDEVSLSLLNGTPGHALGFKKTAGANIVRTVDAIRAALPQITAALPPGVKLEVLGDRAGIGPGAEEQLQKPAIEQIEKARKRVVAHQQLQTLDEFPAVGVIQAGIALAAVVHEHVGPRVGEHRRAHGK